jgi:myo-inositol-1-phosphate synthase
VYSPETWCFVPQEINSIILNCKGSSGDLPIGVTRNKDKFEARFSVNGKRVYLGIYTNANEAFAAYKQAKEKYIKKIAQEYYSQSKITESVYNALVNYKININD